MKKVLLTTAALGLGLALSASVATAMTFTAGGKANLTGIYLNHGDHSRSSQGGNAFKAGLLSDDTDGNVDGWHQSFYLYPKLMINDQTSVQGEMRFIDREVYGSDAKDNGDMMKVFKLWANWNSPFGTVSFGRMPAGTFGSKFLDSTGRADRIKISTSMGAVGVWAVYQKNLETDAYWGDTEEGDDATFYAGVSFGSDMGQTDLAVAHNRIDEDASSWDDESSHSEVWYNGNYSLGAIGIAAEAKYALGEDEEGDDISSFAAMINANTNIDNLTVGFLGFYGQGDDENDGDNNGFVTASGFGNDFNPFVIATGDYFGILNGDKNSALSAIDFSRTISNGWSAPGNGDNPGAIAAALYAAIPISDQLTVSAAIGHIWADEDFGLDNKMGWEVDFNMSYKLADNLTYAASVAYMKPGEMIEDFADIDQWYPNSGFTNPNTNTDGTNSIIAVVQSLTMTW
jgi:hypothetical protein